MTESAIENAFLRNLCFPGIRSFIIVANLALQVVMFTDKGKRGL